MIEPRLFHQALDALVELKAELAEYTPVLLDEPTLDAVLRGLEPFPRDHLFLGQATDDLPVMLNLSDSAAGPLLIQADAGAGKTEYLKSVAAAIEIRHSPKDVQYGVVTGNPEEWASRAPGPHNIGVFPVRERIALDFVLSLNSWAHSNRSQQAVVLLWDDLSIVSTLEAELVHNFRWLLLRGPARKVWPIVTLNTSARSPLQDWQEYFRTCINGRVETPVNGLLQNGARQPRGDGYDFWMNNAGEMIDLWMPREARGGDFPLLLK